MASGIQHSGGPLDRYRHYKGKVYEVLNLATHSETLESMVVYRALYGENKVWVRPEAMFFDEVALPDGTKVKRFEKQA